MRPGISTFRLQSITSSVEAGLTLPIGRFFRQLSEGRVCQDTSLWVLGDDPITILQNKTMMFTLGLDLLARS